MSNRDEQIRELLEKATDNNKSALSVIYDTMHPMPKVHISQKLSVSKMYLDQALALLEKQPCDVFEIRIPNLRKDEVAMVRKVIHKFAKELLNSLTLQRSSKNN